MIVSNYFCLRCNTTIASCERGNGGKHNGSRIECGGKVAFITFDEQVVKRIISVDGDSGLEAILQAETAIFEPQTTPLAEQRHADLRS